MPEAAERSRRSLRSPRSRARLAVAVAVAAAAAGAALAAASCGEQVHGVRLVFTDDGLGTRGFVCKESGGDDYLAHRAAISGHASIVVDFIRLGGSPLCRPIKLLDWCREHECEIIENLRHCIDLSAAAGADPAAGQDAVSAALASLEGSLVAEDAPEEPVLVRVVATALTCADVEKGGLAFDCQSLVGCANSCPIYLPAVSEVPLDLDVAGAHCEDAVVVCASSDVGTPDPACLGPP